MCAFHQIEVYAISQAFFLVVSHRVSGVLQELLRLLQSQRGMAWNGEYEISVGGLRWNKSEVELEDAVISPFGKILDPRVIFHSFSLFSVPFIDVLASLILIRLLRSVSMIIRTVIDS